MIDQGNRHKSNSATTRKLILKEDIILLTGWGATNSVWEPIIPALSECGQINSIQPGWVKDSIIEASLGDFDVYIEKLSTTLNAQTRVIAWSLGGLIAIALASKKPELVKSICFISSTPNFVCENDNNAGIDYQWFQSFSGNFDKQPIETLQRFLLLQVKGDAFAKSTSRFLKNNFDFENYNLEECKHGLALLEKLNMSDKLTALTCKKMFIHGDKDAVVSLPSVHSAASLGCAQVHVIEGAGHVPQVSHSQAVIQLITQAFQQQTL